MLPIPACYPYNAIELSATGFKGAKTRFEAEEDAAKSSDLDKSDRRFRMKIMGHSTRFLWSLLCDTDFTLKHPIVKSGGYPADRLGLQNPVGRIADTAETFSISLKSAFTPAI